MHINILVQIFWSDFISAMNSLVLNTLLVTANTLAVKVPVNWPFLDLVPFNKQDHVQLFVHHGRIFGNIGPVHLIRPHSKTPFKTLFLRPPFRYKTLF